MDLNDLGSPTWSDGQFIRACSLRFQRGDETAWTEFLQRLGSDRELIGSVRELLIYGFIVQEVAATNEVELNVTSDIVPLSNFESKPLIDILNYRTQDTQKYPHQVAHLYREESENKFIPPSKESPGEIMYVEMKTGLAGPARIGRVRFSKTGKTLYYADRKLQSLKGAGYKANYYNVESAMHYWVSKCRKDGNDTLYPGIVEIDDDVREEYWTEIRKQPENKHLTKFRSHGKYSKRRPS